MKEKEILNWIMPLCEENYSNNPIKYKNETFLLKEINFKASNNYRNKIKILLLNYLFIKDVVKIRETFKIPKDGFNSSVDCLKWAINLKDFIIKEYNLDINILLKNHLISDRWKKLIEHYILFNNVLDFLIPKPVEVTIFSGDNEITLKIQKDTKMSDISLFWSEIKMWQDSIVNNKEEYDKEMGRYLTLEDNKLKIKGFKRGKKIFDLKGLRKYKEIFEMKVFGMKLKHISEKAFNNKYDWTKVSSYISKYEKAIKNNRLY